MRILESVNMDTADGGSMNPDTRNDHIRRVRRVSEYIRNNLDEELTLDKLSREAHFSPFHFHRIFKGKECMIRVLTPSIPVPLLIST